MISLLFYSVFFLFSSTKIGHGRPSVKNRYAISDKNILRSYVVRYFYPKFLACHPSASWEMYKKKEKKCIPVQCVGSSLIHFCPLIHFTSYRQLLAHTWRVPGFINLLSPANCQQNPAAGFFQDETFASTILKLEQLIRKNMIANLSYCSRHELYSHRFLFDNRDFQCVFNLGQSFE